MDDIPIVKVEARCECEPFRLVMLYRANRMAALGCPECGQIAVHIEIDWPKPRPRPKEASVILESED